MSMHAKLDRQDAFLNLPVPQAVAKFAIPTILSQLVTLLYNLADTFFVGHTNDPSQVAALTLSFPLFMSLTIFSPSGLSFFFFLLISRNSSDMQ